MSFKRYMVQSFLDQFCELLDDGLFFLVNRNKNEETRISLGYTVKNIQQELATLTIENYCSGPEKNDEFPGQVMVFGKIISGKEIYIKLAVTDKTGENNTAVCISFHFADFPMNYRLR